MAWGRTGGDWRLLTQLGGIHVLFAHAYGWQGELGHRLPGFGDSRVYLDLAGGYYFSSNAFGGSSEAYFAGPLMAFRDQDFFLSGGPVMEWPQGPGYRGQSYVGFHLQAGWSFSFPGKAPRRWKLSAGAE